MSEHFYGFQSVPNVFNEVEIFCFQEYQNIFHLHFSPVLSACYLESSLTSQINSCLNKTWLSLLFLMIQKMWEVFAHNYRCPMLRMEVWVSTFMAFSLWLMFLMRLKSFVSKNIRIFFTFTFPPFCQHVIWNHRWQVKSILAWIKHDSLCYFWWFNSWCYFKSFWFLMASTLCVFANVLWNLCFVRICFYFLSSDYFSTMESPLAFLRSPL